MTETSHYWQGTVTGDATLAPYSASVWTSIWRKMYQADRTTQAVISGYANELAVTNPAGSTIRVATGAALVDGSFYENDANVDFAVSTPSSGDYYYRIALRKNPTTQTVRLVLLGPKAVDYPAVSQTDGSLWEVSIARVKVTSAGVITIYEGRRFCGSPMNGRTKLMEVTLRATSSLVEFGEIPQTYKHLQVVCNVCPGLAGSAPYIDFYLNGDTGANYEYIYTVLKGDGTITDVSGTAFGGGLLGQFYSMGSDYKYAVEGIFADYRSAKYKTVLGKSGGVASAAGNSYNFIATSHWRNTAAITKIEIGASSAFSVGDVFTLYGWN